MRKHIASHIPLVLSLLAAPSADLLAEAPAFQTSDRCIACHNGLTTQTGEDISIGFDWRASMMANSARDPYWQAAVRRETIDHAGSSGAIQDECATCHMTMARFQAHSAGRPGQVFSHLPIQDGFSNAGLAGDGVSCTVCHQIQDGNFGERESFVGGFLIDDGPADNKRLIFGQYNVDAGRQAVMRSSTGGFEPTEGRHVEESELCATCHTLYTHTLGPNGDVIGELPEQAPYLEWRHSSYRESRSCQSCHMPAVAGETAITKVLGQPRDGFLRHVFRGGNFFLPKMLNRYRNELGVSALPQELEAMSARSAEHLQLRSARITLESVELGGGRVEADLSIQNLAGHKLPTAYPSRRVWLHVVLRDREGEVVFESGAAEPNGRIEGNDNDRDPNLYEPHHAEIRQAEQVQIYEAIMVDRNGQPTTGLLSAVRFKKDNRLLPAGFAKETADSDIAAQGAAAEDANFQGGRDQVRYSIPVGSSPGPFQIEANLWYQPISYRWARNLDSYDSSETRRFSRYYGAMAPASRLLLTTQAAAGIGAPR